VRIFVYLGGMGLEQVGIEVPYDGRASVTFLEGSQRNSSSDNKLENGYCCEKGGSRWVLLKRSALSKSVSASGTKPCSELSVSDLFF
jgi:hypothetical protein